MGVIYFVYPNQQVSKRKKPIFLGHTSVQMCRRIMANLNTLGSIRSSYASPEAFDIHPTTKHTEQNSFPGQIKGMWFCVNNGFFKVSGSTVPYHYPLQGPVIEKKVSNIFLDVKEKGEEKLREKFESKLHECFPSFRKFSFQRVFSSDN